MVRRLPEFVDEMRDHIDVVDLPVDHPLENLFSGLYPGLQFFYAPPVGVGDILEGS